MKGERGKGGGGGKCKPKMEKNRAQGGGKKKGNDCFMGEERRE